MNNFEFVCKKRFNEINNNLYMYKHSSGLSLYYYPNMTSNSFSIVTRIKDNDTSDVFHILEHMLCRGNKNNKYFDLFTFFKKFQDTKFRATTNFSSICFQFDNKNVNEYFGLANTLLNNIFNPSLLKEYFWIEGYSVRKNSEGIPTITGRVYNEVKNKNKRDIDIYRDFIVGDITNEQIKNILDVSYEDVIDAYNKYFVPNNMIIIASGKFKPEVILEKLDDILSKYNLKNKDTNINNELIIKDNGKTVEHTFLNVKESNKIDASLFFKIENLSYTNKKISEIALTYIQKCKLEEIEKLLQEVDENISLSMQIILDEKNYNFVNFRIFNIDKQNVQSILLKIKDSLSNIEFNIEGLKQTILNKQIEQDEKTGINAFATKELISYLVSSNYRLIDYDEDIIIKISNLLSSNNILPFKETFNKLINENNLYTYLFKNEVNDVLENNNITYNESVDLKISKFIEELNCSLENEINVYLTRVKNDKIIDSMLLSERDYTSKRKFKESKIILSNDDSSLTYEKELLVYLLSLGIKSLLESKNDIYKSYIETRNGQIQIIILTDNNDIDMSNEIIEFLKDTDFNCYKSYIIAYISRQIELIKNAFNKKTLIFSTVSNLARESSFNDNSLCILELENRLSFINDIDLNMVKDYLLSKKDMTTYNLSKNNYSNVLFLSNKSNLTSVALNIKKLSLSIEESKIIESNLKEILEFEINQKRGLYGYYVQCSHDIFMIGIICDNNYKESLSLIDKIMNSYASNNNTCIAQLSNFYLSNKNNLKTCILVNKKNANYKKEDYDLIYEFND